MPLERIIVTYWAVPPLRRVIEKSNDRAPPVSAGQVTPRMCLVASAFQTYIVIDGVHTPDLK